MAERERVIRAFLYSRVFDPILHSPHASSTLKEGIRLTIQRLEGQDADDMIRYIHWLTEHGSDTSGAFAEQIRREGFTRFEDIRHEFDMRFNPLWQHAASVSQKTYGK